MHFDEGVEVQSTNFLGDGVVDDLMVGWKGSFPDNLPADLVKDDSNYLALLGYESRVPHFLLAPHALVVEQPKHNTTLPEMGNLGISVDQLTHPQPEYLVAVELIELQLEVLDSSHAALA